MVYRGVEFPFAGFCLFVRFFSSIFFWGGGSGWRWGPSIKGRFNHYCVWTGSRLDGGSRRGVGMSREGNVCCHPSLFLPPPILEGSASSLWPTKPKPRCRIKGRNTCFEEGPWDGSRYGCEGFLVFECVAAWKCSAAQLRTSLTW